jgi:flagellar hook-associated protein 2
MGTPITFSGFNSVDFNLVLNSVMASAAQPLTALQNRQSAVQSQIANLATLTSKASAVQTAAAALSTAATLTSFSAASTNAAAVAVSTTSGGVAGHYDIIVNELAHAQVMASASSAPDANTTAVATGGSMTINGQIVAVTQPATLQQLADAINAKEGIGVTASVIQASANSFRLVLTANSSGVANGFTVTNSLTLNDGNDPSSVAFTDTPDGQGFSDGISGNSALDNAVNATDASVLVNNILVTSASNTLTSVIGGATLTVLKKDPGVVVGIDVAADTSALRTRINTFVAAYNSLNAFTSAQRMASGNGDPTSIGRDPLLGQLRTQLRTSLNTEYDAGGAFTYLSQIGVEFTQSGTLQVNNTMFAEATKNGGAALSKLLVGTAGTPGAFASINTLMTQYTQTSGLLASSQAQRASQVSRLTDQISSMQNRLAVQRASLQREFAAADAAMTALKNQSGALASFGTSSSKLTSPTSQAS